MKKFLIKKLNPRIHSTMIVVLWMNGNLEFRKTKNGQGQAYKGVGVNSKGAVSIFLVMSILAAVLAIALGTSFVASTELKLSSNSSESVSAYYAAETGIEEALYDKAKLSRVPRGNRCVGNCPGGFPGWVCSGEWMCTENVLGAGAPYCVEITTKDGGLACNLDDIISIKSIGEHKTTRRSIEINF